MTQKSIVLGVSSSVLIFVGVVLLALHFQSGGKEKAECKGTVQYDVYHLDGRERVYIYTKANGRVLANKPWTMKSYRGNPPVSVEDAGDGGRPGRVSPSNPPAESPKRS